MCACFLKPRPRLAGSLTGISCTNERTAPILAQSPHLIRHPSMKLSCTIFVAVELNQNQTKSSNNNNILKRKNSCCTAVLHEGSETMQRQTWIVPGGIEHAAACSQAIVRCQHHQTISLTLNFKWGKQGYYKQLTFSFEVNCWLIKNI